MWKIPSVAIGDKVRMLEDVSLKNGELELKVGEEFSVTDVGTRYGLPFISPEGLTHEIQLSPRTYEKV